MKIIAKKRAAYWHARTCVIRSIVAEINGGIGTGGIDVALVRRVADGRETTFSHPVITRVRDALKLAGLYKPKPKKTKWQDLLKPKRVTAKK